LPGGRTEAYLRKGIPYPTRELLGVLLIEIHASRNFRIKKDVLKTVVYQITS